MRRLVCTKCAATIQVHELPVEHIDPDLFVCGNCLEPSETPQLALTEREEHHDYNPRISAIEF